MGLLGQGMTRKEWFYATDFHTMLAPYLDSLSRRKLRLFACACCRLLGDADLRCRTLLELCEAYADGECSWSAVKKAKRGRIAEPCFFAADRREIVAAWQAAEAAERKKLPRRDGWTVEVSDLVRDLFSNLPFPVAFQPEWRTREVFELAQAAYAERKFERLPRLAEALADAGCVNEDILAHCRSSLPHVRGCWVVDLILVKW